MKDIKSSINEVFRLLRDRPGLIINGDVSSLSSYVMFFEGFFISLKIFKEIDVEREVSRWYQEQIDTKAPNMYWFAQFEMKYKKLDELKKIDTLLELLGAFFNEKMSLFVQNENKSA